MLRNNFRLYNTLIDKIRSIILYITCLYVQQQNDKYRTAWTRYEILLFLMENEIEWSVIDQKKV